MPIVLGMPSDAKFNRWLMLRGIELTNFHWFTDSWNLLNRSLQHDLTFLKDLIHSGRSLDSIISAADISVNTDSFMSAD